MSKSSKPTTLPQDHPVTSRKTVRTIQNETGKIVKLDAVNYGIQTDLEETMLPVNLPENFFKEGMRVSFSGQLKEMNMNELMAAQPIILTEVHKK